MNETLITDLVAQQALEQLEQLDTKMQGTLETYKDCARELAAGLKINVEIAGDVEKLKEIYTVQMQKTSEATRQLTQQSQQMQQTIANTTNTISRELAEQEKLNKVQREAFEQNQNALSIADRILGTREQNIRQLTEYKKQLEQVKNAQKAGTITSEQAASKELELKTAIGEVQKVLRNQEKMNQAASGSYQQLSLQLERLKQAQKQLNDEEKNSAGGQELEKEIQNLDAHLKDLAADMGEFQRNVGNYAIANKSVKTELKELTAQMAQMIADGVDPTSKEFYTLAERAGTLKDAMSDAKETISDYANDTKGLTNTLSVIETGMEGFQVYTGALSAFGFETAEADKAMQKMMGIMTALNGLQKISTELTTNGTGAYRAYHAILKLLGIEKAKQVSTTTAETAATAKNTAAETANATATGAAAVAAEANTVATGAETAAMVTATGAAIALKVALAALGIGAVIALIGTLCGVIVEWNEDSDEAAKKQEELAKEIDNTSNSYGENRAKLESLKQSWLSLKSEQEKNEFIKNNQDAFDDLGVAVTSVDDANNLLINNTNAFIKSMELRSRAAAYGALAANEYAKAVKAMETGEGVDVSWGDSVVGWFKDLYHSDLMYDTHRRQAETNARHKAAAEAEERARDYTKQQLEYEKEASDVLANTGIKNKTKDSAKSSARSKGSRGGSTSVKAEDIQGDIDNLIAESTKIVDDWDERMQKAAIGLYKTITSTDKKAYEDQIKVVDVAYDKLSDMYKEDGNNAVAESDKKYNKMIEKAEKAGKDTTKLEEARIGAASAISSEWNEKVIANEKEKNETLAKMQEDYTTLLTEEINKRTAAEQLQSDIAYSDKMSALKKRYVEEVKAAGNNEKKIAEIKAKFDEEVATTSEQYAIETAQREIDNLSNVLKVEGLDADQRATIEEQLAKAKIKLAEKTADAEKRATDSAVQNDTDARDKRIANAQAWMQRASEACSNITDLVGSVYDNQISQIEAQIDAEQEQHDRRIEEIENLAATGAITAEEAEIRKRDAEAATAKKREELEKRKAAAEYKKAIVEKANSISQIGISTALGIMRALPNIPLAAFVGAMGAIQVATALAQPIKAYKEGTKGKPHPGGPAIVGDGGRPELVTYNGRAWITPDTSTLIDLPKGAEVMPDFTPKTLEDLGASVHMILPKGNANAPIVINDYQSLEAKVGMNTKVMRATLGEFSDRMAKEMRRQRFRNYIKERT